MAPSFMAVQTIGTVLSVVSAIQSGRARRAEAEFNRKQLEFKAKMQKLEATEKANLRLRDFDSAQASNLAFAAFIGRDPGDRSMKAFLDRQEEIAYQDVQALESGALIESSQTRRLAATASVSSAKHWRGSC